MISVQCREILNCLKEWLAKANEEGNVVDHHQIRAKMNIFPLIYPRLEKKTFRVNGIQYEWVCESESNPDFRLLYLHGGGFVFGDIETTVPFARLVAKYTGCSVLVIEYHLSPEYPYPSALNDAVLAFQWMLINGPNGASFTKKAAIAGDSAGGNLTIATLLRLRDTNLILPDCAIALSPCVNLVKNHFESKEQSKKDSILSENFIRFCDQAYCAGSDSKNPYISPLFADLKGLPPIMIQVCENELFYEDCRQFAQKAGESDVSIYFDAWPEMFHSWQLFAESVPESQQALDKIGQFIKGFTE